MRRIVFSWDPDALDGQGELHIRIDDQDLAEMVHAVELPFADGEGKPEIAGDYAGVRPHQLAGSIREHFMGSSGSDLGCGASDKTVLLGCQCGDLGCWPLMAHIDVKPHEVVWSEFAQPHRAETWSYARFGDLVFERTQYEDALAQAEAFISH
jgi:hypothetical protein